MGETRSQADPAGESVRMTEVLERESAYRDVVRSRNLGVGLSVPILFLVLLAYTKSRGLWPDGFVDRSEDGSGYWIDSMWSIVLLLMAMQLIAALLISEYAVSKPRLQQWLVWSLRLLIVVAVAGAICLEPPEDWAHLARHSFTLELCVLAGLMLVAWPVLRTLPVPPDSRSVPETEREPEPHLYSSDDLVAIGASGGGIRAASFVLGGHQAIQAEAAGLGIDERQPPDIFAVSGGSYIASAIALRRTYDLDGNKRDEPSDWSSAYAPRSPELEWLRRHTRYLFEPPSRLGDGFISLAIGLVVNLFLVAAGLRFLTWVSAQFAGTTGLIKTVRDGGHIVLLEFAPSWGADQWRLLFSVPIFCAICLVLATFATWVGGQVLSGKVSDKTRRRVYGLVKRVPIWRVGLVGLASGWLILTLLLPAAAYGIATLTTSNRPTQTAATVLDQFGFGVESMCEEAMAREAVDAINYLNDEARLSPGEKRDLTVGACGFSTEIARQLDQTNNQVIDLPPYDYDWAEKPSAPFVVSSTGPGKSVESPVASEDYKEEVEKRAIDVVGDRKGTEGQLAGILAALALVGGLLRRGSSAGETVPVTWGARLRKVVMTWLPISIIALLAVDLALMWTFRFLIQVDDQYLTWSAAITVVAVVIAYVVDANAPSMHGFYRSRISEAFAVGVAGDGRAAELPYEKVYKFSDMRRATVPLNVVTTLNSQASGEAPTQRGGFPVVFSPDYVTVHREQRREVRKSTAAYEDFAGQAQVSVMAVVGMSGAALSPLMGRYSAQMAPYRLLLTLFNLRTGVWVRNPEHTPGNHAVAKQRHFLSRTLWLTHKPGLAQVVLEGFGSSSANRRWVYLSDGGHLDNTGLVECVRHCVRRGKGGRILILDASNDVAGSWSAISNAISVIRADIGVDLRRKAFSGDEPPWARLYADKTNNLEALVVKAVSIKQPELANKLGEHKDLENSEGGRDWAAELPPDVAAFQATHPDFPRASTARQKFGDLEFEAYRELGRFATRRAMELAGWLRVPQG